MNSIIKKFFIIILIIIFLLAFYGSYSSSNISNLAVVVAMGFDVSEKNKLKISFQFTNTSSVSDTGSSEKSPSSLFTIESSSISNAINLMNTYIGKEINLSHCKLIVFSEELASRGISEEIYTLANNTQVRPSANIVVSKCTAKSYIENSKPTLENLITKYYEVFVNSSQFTGYTANATIGDFFYSMICNVCEPYAILGGISSENTESLSSINSQKDSNGKASESSLSTQSISENNGLAIFKKDKLVGELSSIETLSFLIIDNQVDGFLISVPDPEKNNSYLDIYLTPTVNTSVKTQIINGTPFIKLNCKFSGRIYSMEENSNYSDSNILTQISSSCNKYIESILTEYLYKTAKIFNTDINRFGKYVRKNFLTESDFDNFNWENNYKESFFDVKVDTSVKSSFLLTET